MSSDDLILTIAGHAISGWTEIRITRGVERLPSDFEIALTEKFPGEAREIFAMPGAPCTVHIGNDLVITGYVDRFVPKISEGEHEVRILGRSKCSGLVDCAAICDSMVINNNTVLGIAQKLAKPFDVTVTCTKAPALLPIIPQYCVDVTETPFEAITRYANYSGLLLYDLPDGNLILTEVSTERSASGFVEGQNVQAATVHYSMDERYSVYEVAMSNVDPFTDLGVGGFVTVQARDPNVTRYRPRIIVADNNNGIAVSKQRALWECARRAGRSKIATITADSWRDAAGKLWTPNTIAEVSLPSCKLQSSNFTIGTVTYSRDEDNGTVAVLELMGSASYRPEPVQLAPLALEFSDELSPSPSDKGAGQ